MAPPTRSGPKSKKATPKKAITKKTAFSPLGDKIVKVPKKLLKTGGHEGQRSYHGPATLGGKKVRSSPTFNKLIVDGQTYVLVPENEHEHDDASFQASVEKCDDLVERLRGIRDELYDDNNQTFKAAGRQVVIAIALLLDGAEGNWNDFNDEVKSGIIDLERAQSDEIDPV